MTRSDEFSLIKAGSALEVKEGSEVAFVIFGGIAEGIGVPPFEFRRMMAEIPVSTLYVRDVAQAWYHLGVDDGDRSLDGAAEHIATVLERIGARRTVFIGNSMGGFAAILLGQKLKADKIIAFAPQTYVDFATRLRTLDFRWSRQIARMYRQRGLWCPTYNLRAYLRGSPLVAPASIYFGTGSRLDSRHARELEGVPNITLFEQQGAGHDMVKSLKASGELHRMLLAAMEVSGS